MKPPRFAYYDPYTRNEVLALLDTYEDEAKVLAGGQSLVPLLNMRLAQPAHLIDINHVSDLSYIRQEAGYLAIGALTRHMEVERSELVQKLCPLLTGAIGFVGHAPIRARGTIGGTLAHADPAAEVPAVLMALGGWVCVESLAGGREIPADQFFLGQLATTLASKEILVEARFPLIPPLSGVSFLEINRRHGDFALVGVATQVSLHPDGSIAAAHIALLGVGETPIRALAAEELLINQQPGESLFSIAAEKASAQLEPSEDMHASSAYRQQVAGTLVGRALKQAAERARGNISQRG